MDLLPQHADTPVAKNRRQHKWMFCIGIGLIAALLTFWPLGMPQFRYDRNALQAGEAWRVVTSHLVHLNGTHLLLNLLALILLCELLWLDLPLQHAAGMLIWSALSVSLLLWWLHPELIWYAGMSGALHGFWGGCALAAWWPAKISPLNVRSQSSDSTTPYHFRASALSMLHAVRLHWLRYPIPQRAAAAGLALLSFKLLSESHFGPSSRTEQAIGGPVVAVAHAYGAASGLAYVLCWGMLQKLFGKTG